jgi:hypothetical protein
MSTRLIAIGACSIDTILTVPHFPQEDAKLRATSFTRRRTYTNGRQGNSNHLTAMSNLGLTGSTLLSTPIVVLDIC